MAKLVRIIPMITCPVCGMTSYNPNDVQQRYCGNCHQFIDLLLAARELSSAQSSC
jgi:hypothetical protein